MAQVLAEKLEQTRPGKKERVASPQHSDQLARKPESSLSKGKKPSV